MKLVIDIPEEIYKELTETAIMVTDAYPSTIERALTEGTPYEERKTGKWIDRTICSNCNWYATNRYGLAVDSHFPYCPNCGAKMEVDE